MFIKRVSPERRGSLFISEVVHTFSFLAEWGYGKQVIRKSHQGLSTDITMVEYYSQEAFCCVYYEHMDSIISFSMGLTQPESSGFIPSIQIHTAARYLGSEPMNGIYISSPRSEKDLIHFQSEIIAALDSLASFIKEKMQYMLCNPTIVFPELKKLDAESMRRYSE